jgi:hypothetical protein
MKESDLQKTVVAWLRRQPLKCVWFAVPNEAKRSFRLANHLKAMGLRAGVADLVFFGFGFIELKMRGNRQTGAQETFEALCLKHGASYAVCLSLEDVQLQLKNWGAY